MPETPVSFGNVDCLPEELVALEEEMSRQTLLIDEGEKTIIIGKILEGTVLHIGASIGETQKLRNFQC